MKRLLILICFILLQCRNDEIESVERNPYDPFNPISWISTLLSASSGSGGPAGVFGYSDRIIVSSYPSIWESNDGTNFTEFTVLSPNCVSSCKVVLAGYESGTYAIFGGKTSYPPGQYFYGTGSDLNGITITATDFGQNLYSLYSLPFNFTNGKFHFAQGRVFTTTDGSSWSDDFSFDCSNIYLADNGNPTCGLLRTYNGTSWVATGGISGGVSDDYSAVYIDNSYIAWKNNSGTLSIFKSTSGTISGGITFPASANGSISMNNGISANPPNLVKTSNGNYLLLAYEFIYITGARSSDGINWESVNPNFPGGFGIGLELLGYTAFGDSFYAVVSVYGISNLFRSSDGVTWQTVTLP